jgi:hypothetical protein
MEEKQILARKYRNVMIELHSIAMGCFNKRDTHVFMKLHNRVMNIETNNEDYHTKDSRTYELKPGRKYLILPNNVNIMRQLNTSILNNEKIFIKNSKETYAMVTYKFNEGDHILIEY